ncbi:hypothetical protein BDV95DRAFT_19493 [Massariosphaeria phaeospora]|uniref:Uncharacterized protein n=1 Tax=Massariosphaeria phaeospora TaxID=100035 RepID=A0A7C8MPG0_9PLEO|nr:hypothetical protein BDV95DRAFT_19493 [Massariosphaeria phaeospora]
MHLYCIASALAGSGPMRREAAMLDCRYRGPHMVNVGWLAGAEGQTGPWFCYQVAGHSGKLAGEGHGAAAEVTAIATRWPPGWRSAGPCETTCSPVYIIANISCLQCEETVQGLASIRASLRLSVIPQRASQRTRERASRQSQQRQQAGRHDDGDVRGLRKAEAARRNPAAARLLWHRRADILVPSLAARVSAEDLWRVPKGLRTRTPPTPTPTPTPPRPFPPAADPAARCCPRRENLHAARSTAPFRNGPALASLPPSLATSGR